MIEIRNVSKTYNVKSGCSVEALKNISLCLPERGVIFLVGKSGSGKTTLVNLIGGIDTPTSGEIIFNGISNKAQTPQHYDYYRNQYVGLIFQEYNLIEDFSVRENIAFAMELQGKAHTDEHINEILTLVGLEGYGQRKTHELSGGQRQRVAIARALAKDPFVIVADEPTGALDSETGKSVMDILKHLSEDRLVVVVSHDREIAEAYADRCIELVDGRICCDTIIQQHIDEDSTSTSQRTVQRDKHRKMNLSMKSALKIGKNCIRKKLLRFIAVITVSVVAFAFLGLADMIASYNKQTVFMRSLSSSKANYVSAKRAEFLSYNSNSMWYDNGFNLDQEDIDSLSKLTGVLYKGVYIPPCVELNIEKNYGSDYPKNTDYHSYVSGFSGFVEFSEEDLNAFGYKLISGRLPENNSDEMAISKYVYDSFRLASYANYTGPKVQTNNGEVLSWDEFLGSPVNSCTINYNPSTTVEKVETIDDFIGKTVFLGSRNYTITGIIDTHFDLSPYKDITKPVANKDTDSLDLSAQLKLGKLDYERKYSLHCAIFVGEGKIDEIKSRYPTVVTVDDMTLSFSNSYATYSTNTVARISDINLLSRGLRWIGEDNNQVIDQSIEGDNGYTDLKHHEILVPVEMIMNSYVQIGDKLYQEVGNTSEEKKCTNLKMALTYDNNRYTEESGDWNIIGAFNGNNFRDTYSIENVVLVSDDFFEKITEGRNGVYAYAVAPTPTTTGAIEDMVSTCENYGITTRFPLMNAISFELNTLDGTLTALASIFRYIGICLSIFSVFLFSNFVSVSIVERKRDIGIMRALGASCGDVFLVFFTESIIMATVNFALSCCLTYITAVVGNYVIKHQFDLIISFVNFGIRQVGILFCLSFIVALLASYIPIRRVAKQTPIEAIRNI